MKIQLKILLVNAIYILYSYKIYVVTSIGDVWILVAHKKSLKTYKLSFDENNGSKVPTKIVTV